MAFIPYSTAKHNRGRRSPRSRCACCAPDFLTQGPAITAFEDAFAAPACGGATRSPSATPPRRCTSPAWRSAIGPGSRVWTSPTQLSSPRPIARCIAAPSRLRRHRPRHPQHLDRRAGRQARRGGARRGACPRSSIPVDFAGLPCDLRRDPRRLPTATASGCSRMRATRPGRAIAAVRSGGQRVDAAVFSFHAVKIVTTGEGGIVTTDDDALAPASCGCCARTA